MLLHLARPAAVAALALTTAFAGATSAAANGPAADQKADGVIVVAGNTCTWTGARTTAVPPAALVIDRTGVNKPGGNLTCGGGITASLNNDPAFAFDDAAGTARTDLIDITGRQSFVTCRYKAANLVWDRDGSTRKYVNREFTATRTSGGFLCPASVTTAAGGASVLFH
ncbi:hypothetical protein ACIRP0_14555 [Streptomyces sp. NPDC101733]|uniref:hypothetical protein n=1 Tax=unclassified Streptomyces TaxID=2593676 RepID=UPI003807DF39